MLHKLNNNMQVVINLIQYLKILLMHIKVVYFVKNIILKDNHK